MFLIKQICVNNMERKVYVEDGMTVNKIERNLRPSNFWGSITLNSGFLPKQDSIKIVSCQSYCINRIDKDYYIDMSLFDSENQFSKTNIADEQFVGYLMFITKALEDVKTNAEVIYMRYPAKIDLISVLKKDGDYIEIGSFRFEYEDNRVSYKTYI